MDIIAYISISIALIVGFLIGISIKTKRKYQKIDSNDLDKSKIIDNLKSDFEKRIQILQSKCKELKRVADTKTAELFSFREEVIKNSGNVDNDSFLKIITDNEEAIKKLKRELEDTKDDLEEAESTSKKLRRQLEEKVSENCKLSENISKLEKSANNLNNSLESALNQLNDSSKRLSSASESLSFIQEVLTAKPINSESLIEKERKIRAISNFIYYDFQELFKQHFKECDYSKEIFGQDLFQWEAVKRKSWIEGKKTIAFIGEFSAGKTSIVNRLLSQDKPNMTLLPVSAKATTAIPTYIAGGDFTTYQFYSPDGSLKGISEKTFKRVSKEILGNLNGVSELIRYFIMTYRNPYLKGISILDTPGFSSGDKEDAIRTIDVINECDALFWVFDVNSGTVNRSSLEVIKTNMTRPLFIIINKIDTKSTSEVDSVEKLIKKAFEEEGIKVEGYLRFSSKTSLTELMTTISSIENDSSAENYLTNLMDDFIPKIILSCENDYKDASKELNDSNKKCDEKRESIYSLCKTIQNACLEAQSIPHWEDRWWQWKDRFEMDKQEGKKLIDLLEKVANTDIKDLLKEIEDYGYLMQENQNSYNQKNKENNTLQVFRDCRTKLNRLITILNRS